MTDLHDHRWSESQVKGGRRVTQILGWCFGCGEAVGWEGGDIHTVPEHDPSCDGGCKYCPVPVPCGPVWPMIRACSQEELEANAPELLAIEAPGHIVEWVPGREPIRLVEPVTGYIPLNVRWLRISADPDGPPVDIDDVRAVARLAKDDGVPVWIERLGSSAAETVTVDSRRWKHYMYLNEPTGSDPDEWPPDLRNYRELPEVPP